MKMFFVCHFNINPCHSLFFGRDHLRSNIGITCGQGSFAVQFGDHLRSGIICGPGIICGLVQGRPASMGEYNRVLQYYKLS